MNDFDAQAAFVVSSVPRLLAQIDDDPLSPTWGCAHLAYWRDKTSDVCDMRRQEAMLTLALISRGDYPGAEAWKDSPVLDAAVSALLTYWCRARYSDGSLDEWYKGERAYAAAAFTTYAVARTLEVFTGRLPSGLAEEARTALRRTAGWLMGRDDLFKTNHQAVGAGAMAWAARVLGEPAFAARAREKLAAIIAVQRPEGWFPEVGRTDPGYTFLTVEYAALAMEALGDWSQAEPFRRAMEAACAWVHPDLTLGAEYGVCRNPYVSRIAALMMAGHSSHAAWLAGAFADSDTGFAGLKPTLADDLRLSRWGYQPLVAWDLARRFQPSPSATPVPLATAFPADAIDHGAGLARLGFHEGAAVFAACAGGLLRLFGGDAGTETDFGYALRLEGGGYATNLAYNPHLRYVQDDGALSVKAPIAEVRKFFPPYWARIVLRLACSTAWSSRLTRRMIDVIRKTKSTAINQSSGNLSTKSPWTLERTVVRRDGELVVSDVLSFDRPMDPARLESLSALGDGPMQTLPLTSLPAGGPVRRLTIVRRWSIRSGWSRPEMTLG